MLVTKIVEDVEYYVFTNKESPDAFVFVNDKVDSIMLPPNAKALSEEYVFIYVGELRAHPGHDFTISDNIVKFTQPMTVIGGITVKMYTKHDGTKSRIEMSLKGDEDG